MADNDFGVLGQLAQMGGFGLLPQIFMGGGGTPSAQPPAAPAPTNAADIAPPLAPGQTEQRADPNGWQTDVNKANWWQQMTPQAQKDLSAGIGKGFV